MTEKIKIQLSEASEVINKVDSAPLTPAETKPILETDSRTGFVLDKTFPIDKKERMLDLLDQNPMLITSACKKLNVHKRNFYSAMEKDEKFRNAVKQLRDMKIEGIEQILFENAHNPKGVSDRMRFLEAFKPDVYARVKTTETSNDSQLAALVERAKKFSKEKVIDVKVVNGSETESSK